MKWELWQDESKVVWLCEATKVDRDRVTAQAAGTCKLLKEFSADDRQAASLVVDQHFGW